MREFYVYGFKSRDEYTKKSARSYDDERRRVESWLGDYMQFRRTPDGKNVFLSIDSRAVSHNPLYKAWKAKSFTDNDITLHFILMDILFDPSVSRSINELAGRIDVYLSEFDDPKTFDVSTIRKKLKEYEVAGIIIPEKRGKTVFYRRAENAPVIAPDLLDLSSEIMPCGVIGSFLLDKAEGHEEHFSFKHHYITGAMDSEALCGILEAMREKRSVTIETVSRGREKAAEVSVVPLKVMISAQSGREYLMAYTPGKERISSYRLDNIVSVKPGDVFAGFDEYRERLDRMLPHIWGVSTQSRSGQRMEHVEFTVRYSDDEQYIPQRLEREKRCGSLERIDGNHIRFSADVYDASELVPWIRTFICRITDISFSDGKLERQFRGDLEEMYALYGLEGGDADAVQ